MKTVMRVGLFIRREMRGILMSLDIPFEENRSFTFSDFYITRDDAIRLATYLKSKGIDYF